MEQILKQYKNLAFQNKYPQKDEEGLIDYRVLIPLLILKELSGNIQIDFLNKVKNPLLKEVLLYTYDSHKKYKLDAKLDKFLNTIGDRVFNEKSWELFKSHLDYLSNKAAATDEEVAKTAEFISRFNKEGQDFCKQVLSKDLRINMGIKKFQKVWNDFCVEPQVQLAQSKADRSDFVNGLYSRKFDGKRMYIKDGIPFSRENNECYTIPIQHILEQVKELLSLNNNSDPFKTSIWKGDVNPNYFILDGECLYFENGIENFQKGISLCQSKERKFGCDNICYVIFDMIPKDKFMTKTPWDKFEVEYDKMIKGLADFSKPTPDYSLIPTKMPNVFIARQDKDPSKLMKLCEEKDWEGLMYRDADSPYEYKRTNKLLKMKKFEDTELKLISMEEGTGKYEGKLGAFIVEYEGSTVNVGSGFADELREEYWNNKDKYIGQYCKVKYFEKTVDQNGKPSLRFPTFLSFRNIETKEEFMKL